MRNLSPREREVVQLMIAGGSCKSIARGLGVTVATVRKHRENLMRKLQVASLGALVNKVAYWPRADCTYDIRGIVTDDDGPRE
jgi:DNA-binding CsgD family transcriptional regulator